MAMGAGLRPSSKVLDSPPDLNVHAPQLYPDIIPNTKSVNGLRPKGSFPYWWGQVKRSRPWETNVALVGQEKDGGPESEH
jgi:hypothetical protein